MAIDLGNTPTGTPPTAGEKLQIRSAIGVGTTDVPTFAGLVSPTLSQTAGSGQAWLTGPAAGNPYLWVVSLNGSAKLDLNNAGNLNISSVSLNGDAILSRDAAGILAQRNGGSTQAFRLYNATSATPLTDWDRASLSFTSGNFRIAAENSGTTGYNTARGIDFVTGGVVRMSIAANGFIGIGTASPAAKLDVYLNPLNTYTTEKITFGPSITFGHATGGAYSGLWLGGVSSPVAPTDSNYVLNSNGAITILNAPTTNLSFRTANTVRMTVLGSSGDVGIGTTSPTSKLHIAGTIKPEQATMVDKAASFTLAAVDAGTIINCTSATAITITLPATDMPAGYNIMIIQSGVGTVTIAAGGNTLQSFGGASATAGQHAACSIVRTAASTYNLSGNLV